MSDARAEWWRGRRGEWFVVTQIALIALIAFGPRDLPGADPHRVPFATRVPGLVMMGCGAVLLLSGAIGLGTGLTPLPFPRSNGRLIQSGPFALVRHPIYAGALLLAFGWGLLTLGLLTLGYAALLLALLDVKSRREERWLIEKFPEYQAYAKRVKRLIPYVY